MNYLKKFYTTLARTINNVVWVYDNFEKITHNLTLECKEIDIRHLSLHQLYLAKDLSWCLAYQEQKKERKDKPKHLDYDEDDFNDLVRTVGNHDVFKSVSDDPRRLTALMSRMYKKFLEIELKK